jgi:demethylphylloquinol methyltransferase
MDETSPPPASEIQEMFDRIAPVYDVLNDRLSFGQHRIWKMMAVKWSGANFGDTALDLCCGSGDLALMLAKRVGSNGKVSGLDFSCQQLTIAKSRDLASPTKAPIDWLEGDALNLPFADNYFDCATMGYGLRNVTDIALCLKELYRVLKPQAKAAILDFHLPDLPYLQSFQQWYLENFVVAAARDFGLEAEYAYINPSLARFPISREQVELATQAGFSSAVHYPLLGGMMGILVLTK